VRYLTSTVFVPFAGRRRCKGAMRSTGGTLADVYPMLFIARDAYGIVPLRGRDSLTPMVVNPKRPGDPLGQRGSVGWKAWQAAVILQDAYIVRVELRRRRNRSDRGLRPLTLTLQGNIHDAVVSLTLPPRSKTVHNSAMGSVFTDAGRDYSDVLHFAHDVSLKCEGLGAGAPGPIDYAVAATSTRTMYASCRMTAACHAFQPTEPR